MENEAGKFKAGWVCMHRHTSYIAVGFALSLFLILSGCSAEKTGQKVSEVSTEMESPLPQTKTEASQPAGDASSYEEELSYFYGLAKPQTLDERFSYAYGYMLMESASKDLPSIDANYFLRGIYDRGIDESQMLSAEERNTAFYEFQTKLVNEASEQLKELAAKNLAEAEDFLRVNGEKEGVSTTESGLQYMVVNPSEGPSPQSGDSVKVNYTLTFLDGREGDSSVPGIPSTFGLDNLIPGFSEGLLLMSEGSSYRFFVHPSLGYGEAGNSRIEPNTLLIFDVELVEILSSSEE